MNILRVQSKIYFIHIIYCVNVIHFCEGYITAISQTYLPLSKIYFLTQNASHDMTQCRKIILIIGNSNAKHYCSKLQLKEMRSVILSIVKSLGHIMLPQQFDFCDVTISTTFLHFS